VTSNAHTSDLRESAIYAHVNSDSPAVVAEGQTALQTTGASVMDGHVFIRGRLAVAGPMYVDASATKAVPAGASSVTAHIRTLKPGFNYFAVATLQQPRPNLWVKAAVPNQNAGTATVYLNRPVAHPVTVAVVVLA
jgi:hypothetical protein